MFSHQGDAYEKIDPRMQCLTSGNLHWLVASQLCEQPKIRRTGAHEAASGQVWADSGQISNLALWRACPLHCRLRKRRVVYPYFVVAGPSRVPLVFCCAFVAQRVAGIILGSAHRFRICPKHAGVGLVHVLVRPPSARSSPGGQTTPGVGSPV